MALFDGVRRQLRSVIQWEMPESDVLFQQWRGNGDELKNASKLIVGPGQGCIFVYEGKIKAVLDKECLLNLKTDNIPFWTTVTKFMQFFESEHKAQLYFYRTTKVLDQKWGTNSPIKYDDPKYKFPVGLLAYGNYSYRIADPKAFFVNVVGAEHDFFIDGFRQVMSGRLVHPLADFLAESRYSYAEIDANREEIAVAMDSKLQHEFGKLGFDITDFRIEGTDFDEATLTRVNRIADLTAEAQAAEAVGLDYARMQQLEAMREAARNEGGGAGLGMGLGAGMGMGQTMAQTMGANFGTATVQESVADDPMQKLGQLKKMFQAELISKDEYAAKKKEILDTL
ncbi:MAG: SPFH domain-containing protein [Methyloprofundus sp.]|nr:SPFH domain-containing protein [Methyloprofundus sp.]